MGGYKNQTRNTGRASGTSGRMSGASGRLSGGTGRPYGNMNRGRNPVSKKSAPDTLNFFALGVSAAAGVIAWLISLIYYHAAVDSCSRPLLIGIIFLILSFVSLFAVFVYSNSTAIFESNIITGGGAGITAGMLLAGSFVIFLLAMLFQWIYGLNAQKVTELTDPTSYIFLIDDSGSMGQNDPNGERFTAIDAVLKEEDSNFPYMIYRFSDSDEIIRDMGPVSDQHDRLTGRSAGGTAIKATLKGVLQDHDQAVWDGGSFPKVILLTDGYESSFSIFDSLDKILKNYVHEGISISTVGLGEADQKTLSKIAAATGGVTVSVNQASDLPQAMRSATAVSTDVVNRDLLTARYAYRSDPLHGFLRILFLSILGSLIGVLLALAYGQEDSAMIILVSSVIGSVAGACLLEGGTSLLGIPASFLCLLLFILLAAVCGLTWSNRGLTKAVR